MRVVLQRVSNAHVTISERQASIISRGLVILLGIEETDTKDDIDWLARKITNLRIFNDAEAKMNFSIQDIHGEFLVISQFTLYAQTKKGNRPSFISAAKPDVAIPLYEAFLAQLNEVSGLQVSAGVFGADMQVTLTNDGPVTIIIDSKHRE